MSNLFDIVQISQAIERELMESGGEVSPEMDLVIGKMETELATKAESIIWVTKRLEANAEFYKQESAKFANASKAMNNAADRLKGYMKSGMLAMGLSEIQGESLRVVLSDTAGSLVIEDEKKIPTEYITQTIVTTVDKAAIKEALKSGPVDGVRLEKGHSLRSYPTKR